MKGRKPRLLQGRLLWYTLLVSNQSGQSGSIDIEAARRGLRERTRRRRERIRQRWERARRDAAAIIEMLIRDYNPVRIYQWGSVLDPRRFSEISDIDIAVEGVASAEQFFAIYRDAEALTDLPLDLVELDKIDPLHAETIRQKGKLVHERK